VTCFHASWDVWVEDLCSVQPADSVQVRQESPKQRRLTLVAVSQTPPLSAQSVGYVSSYVASVATTSQVFTNNVLCCINLGEQ
jgi:hypothetical protein